MERAIALIDENETLEEVLEHLQPSASGGHARIEADWFAFGQADHLLSSELPRLGKDVRGAEPIRGHCGHRVLERAESGKTGPESSSMFQHYAPGDLGGSGRGCIDPPGNESFGVDMRHPLFLSDGSVWTWIHADSTARLSCLPQDSLRVL